MREINVLLTSSFAEDNILEQLRAALAKKGISIKASELRMAKASVIKCLQLNPDMDFILIPEYFEREKMPPSEFEQIHRLAKDDTVIVLLVQDSEYGSDYMRQLLAHGINNALFEKDASFDNIVSRIEHPLSRKDAVSYYGLSATGMDMPVSNDTDKIQEAAKYLMNCGGDINDLCNRMAQVSGRLSGRDLIDTVSLLSDEAIEHISRMDRYSLVAKAASEKKADRIAARETTKNEIKPRGGLFNSRKKRIVAEPAGKKKGLFSGISYDEEDDDVPVSGRSNVRSIAFASINKGVGCTYSALLCAFSLVKTVKGNPHVAVLEIDNQDDHFENLCRLVRNSANIQGIHDFSFGGVDFYFSMPVSAFDANFRARYDYVIYDYGCVPNDVIEHGISACDRVFIIGSASEYRYGEVVEFYREVSPLDLQDSFIYLFSDFDVRDLGNMAQVIKKNRIDAIPREVDVFNPTRETVRLFDCYVHGQPERIREPKSKSLNDKLTQRPAVTANTLTILVSILLLLTAVFFGITVISKNRRYDTLKANAALKITNLTEIQTEKDVQIEALNQQIKDSCVTAAVLKDDAAAGTLITDDMLTTMDFHCDLPEGTFLTAEEIAGKYSACNITKDTPLYDYFVAEYVDEPMPPEEDIPE